MRERERGGENGGKTPNIHIYVKKEQTRNLVLVRKKPLLRKRNKDLVAS